LSGRLLRATARKRRAGALEPVDRVLDFIRGDDQRRQEAHHILAGADRQQILLTQRGDEIALHGYSHRDDLPPRDWLDRLRRRHYTRGEGEFWALPEAEAKRRIDAGIAWFRSNGWIWHGFVAPAWLLGPQAWPALEGFEYTATLRHIVRLPGRERVASQSVVYSTSSAWRRRSSLAWNAVVSRLERGNPLLRIELHPRDADFTAVRRSWQKILERALRDRRASTVADFVRQSSDLGATPTTFWQTTTTAD